MGLGRSRRTISRVKSNNTFEVMKIESDFIKKQYQSGVDSYADFTTEVGLWQSEKHVFEKYIKKSDDILDLGCGTGRTTFALYKSGFEKIIGVDLTPEMIRKAKELNNHFQTKIEFNIGDALNLEFPDSIFDVVIFSFNGLMSIPKQSNRDKAIQEISRVLKESGVFIFTTHDREEEAEFFEFWKTEKEKWASSKQNPKLHEFGDLIAQSKNETSDIFIHIPNQKEVKNWLKHFQFELIETFYRSEQFEENEEVKKKSGECRFWIVRNKK